MKSCCLWHQPWLFIVLIKVVCDDFHLPRDFKKVKISSDNIYSTGNSNFSTNYILSIAQSYEWQKYMRLHSRTLGPFLIRTTFRVSHKIFFNFLVSMLSINLYHFFQNKIGMEDFTRECKETVWLSRAFTWAITYHGRYVLIEMVVKSLIKRVCEWTYKFQRAIFYSLITYKVTNIQKLMHSFTNKRCRNLVVNKSFFFRNIF